MKWFRFYDDVMDNPKLMGLPAETYRFWTQLLCIASRMEVRGTLPSVEEIAYRTRLVQIKTAEMLAELTASKLVGKGPKGRLLIVDWGKYQPHSDDGAERKRNQRKGKGEPKPSDMSRDKGSEVTSTPPDMSRDMSRDNHRDGHGGEEIRLEEKEEKPPHPPRSGGESAGSLDVGSFQECAETALDLHGDNAVNAVSHFRDSIREDLTDGNGRVRWDYYAAALRAADVRKRQPKAETIRDLHAWCMTLCREWVVTGIPPAPVTVLPFSQPAEPFRPYHVAHPDSWAAKQPKTADLRAQAMARAMGEIA